MDIIEKLKYQPIQIENFLPIESANFLYEKISKFSKWEVQSKHKSTYEFEKKKYNDGEFSYYFRTILDNNFVHQISEEVGLKDAISKLLNKKEFIEQTMFISKYIKGDFLSPHNDRNWDRKYAFIYNLTKNTDESKGGFLNFIDEKQNIIYKLEPKFNSINIFDVINNQHFVTEIISDDLERYSIGGWTKETNMQMKLKNSLM